LLSAPEEYTYAKTTESRVTFVEEPDSKAHTDERHQYQPQGLPLASADHVSSDQGIVVDPASRFHVTFG
jgi:hypothetical protein